jgi:hypothetical protein
VRDPDVGSSSSVTSSTNDYSGITFSYDKTPTPSGYGALSQSELRNEIARLESLRPSSRSVGDVASWRIGEELSMAKLYLKDEEPKDDTGGDDGSDGGPTIVYSASLTVSATPPTPIVTSVAPPVPVVKTATPQYILPGEDIMPAEIMTDLIFENIGGQELLLLSRHDLISGDYIPQQLIANIKKINNEYDPKNLFISQTSNKYFANFSIKLNSKIPNVGNGTDGSNVYLDTDGGIVIEFIDLLPDEQADIQITTDGTIYEVVN